MFWPKRNTQCQARKGVKTPHAKKARLDLEVLESRLCPTGVVDFPTILLYNPPSAAEPYAQTGRANISNFTSVTQTYRLAVVQLGTGNIRLSNPTTGATITSVTVGPGATVPFGVVPTADSSSVGDVGVEAMQGGNVVGSAFTTVVGVTIPQHIRNTDTPAGMVDRIPPGNINPTPVAVTVTPSLAGSGQFVTLTVAGQSNDNGTVLIGGSATQVITSTGTFNLTTPAGVQTAPNPLAPLVVVTPPLLTFTAYGGLTFEGFPGNLHLAVQVNGQPTIESAGFSVAAIPVNYSEVLVRPVTEVGNEPARGIVVQDGWQSDSGNIADLGQVALSEQVQTIVQGGFFAGLSNATSQYIGPASLFTQDIHYFLLSAIHTEFTTGTALFRQTSVFLDRRTGAEGIPMSNSGYVISFYAYRVGDVGHVTTTKVGTPTEANGIVSGAGQGNISLAQDFLVPAGGDPLVVTTQPPSSVTAGVPFGLVVTAKNASGQTNTSFNGSVTVSSNSGGGLTGSTTVTAVNGVATFSGLTLTQAGTFSLTVSGGGLPPVVTQPITVTAASATQMQIVTEPPLAVSSGASFTINVIAVDPYGNIDTSYFDDLSIAIAANPANGTLGGTPTASMDSGVASFSGLTLDNPGSGYTLQVSSGFGELPPATTNPITVAPTGTATQLAITAQPPGSISAGSGFGLTVTAEDSLGNPITTFNGDITLSLDNFSGSTDSTLGGTITLPANNGVATFSGMTIDRPGSYSVDATSTGLVDATTNDFSVTPLPARQLAVLGPTGNVTVGEPFGLTVAAEDAYGNVDTTFKGTVTLTLPINPGAATLGGTLKAVAINGVATFTGLTISKTGSAYVLQASGGGLQAGNSPPFNVTTDVLVVTTQPPTTVTAGSGFGLTVAAENGAGGVDKSYKGSVTLALDNPFGGSSSIGGTLTEPVVNGVATFAGLTVDQADAYALSVIANGATTAVTNLFTVTAAPATQLLVTTQPPAAVTVGAGFGVTITAEDPFGNVDPTFDANVTLGLAANTANGNLGGTISGNAASGMVTFSGLTLDTAGGGYTLAASGNGLTSAPTSAIDVTAPGVANQLVVTTEPPDTVAAGTGFSLVVSAEDSFGTVDANFTGTVTVADPTTGTVAQMAASVGVASFSNVVLNQAGPDVLSATSAGLAAAATSVINVTALTASQLVLLGPYDTVLTGSPFGLNVLAVDPEGNIDPTFNGSVTLSLGPGSPSATLGGAVTENAVDGLASFSGLTIDNPGSGFTLQATSAAGPAGASSAFAVDQPPRFLSPNAAVFTVGQSSPDTITTTGFPAAALTVSGGSLPDGVTFTDNGGGTATLSGMAGAATGSYTFNITANNGVTAPATQVFTLTVVDPPAITSAASSEFTVGAKGRFSVTTSPGLPAATALSVKGMLPTGVSFTDNRNGTATLAGTPAAGTAGTYTLTVTASNGPASSASQTFTLHVDQALAPSGTADLTFATGAPDSVNITAKALAATSLGESGMLPSGVTFTDNGDGTATLSGTPASGTERATPYSFTVTASKRGTTVATETFQLSVDQPPVVTSTSATFTVGVKGTFTIQTTAGLPATTTLSLSGALPAGVSFSAKNGTATLSGTPAPGTAGTYTLLITASNAVESVTQQTFTLTVVQPPTVTSGPGATFTVGQTGSVTVTNKSFAATTALTENGTLPAGVSFADNGNGTATFSGTPEAGTGGPYGLSIRGSNGVTMAFTLTIVQPPIITSAASATFTAGQPQTFTVSASGSPSPKLALSGAPSWLTLTSKGNGIAVVSGKTANHGTFTFTIVASVAGLPPALQTFVLTVN